MATNYHSKNCAIYKGLASIKEEEAKALLKQLEETLNQGQSRERWIALGINIVAGLLVFLLGVFLSPLVRQAFGLATS